MPSTEGDGHPHGRPISVVLESSTKQKQQPRQSFLSIPAQAPLTETSARAGGDNASMSNAAVLLFNSVQDANGGQGASPPLACGAVYHHARRESVPPKSNTPTSTNLSIAHSSSVDSPTPQPVQSQSQLQPSPSERSVVPPSRPPLSTQPPPSGATFHHALREAVPPKRPPPLQPPPSGSTIHHAQREAVPPKCPPSSQPPPSGSTFHHAQREAVPPKDPSHSMPVSFSTHATERHAPRAHPEGTYFVSDKRVALQAFINRKRKANSSLTEAQQVAARQLEIDVATSPGNATLQILLKQSPKLTPLLSWDPSVAFHFRDDKRRAKFLARGKACKQKRAQEKLMHIGSSRPHAIDGDQEQFQRGQRKHPTASLRHLEPEDGTVLIREPLPNCNIPQPTEFEYPPPRVVNPPGPFTSAQLLTQNGIEELRRQGEQVASALDRAERGSHHVAKSLRPEALILKEDELFNECGFGHQWIKHKEKDSWSVLQPSSFHTELTPCGKHAVHDPPDTTFDGLTFAKAALEAGLVDHRVISWGLHGFPGARTLPTDITVVGTPHVGALKHARDFEAMNQRDIANGFVSHGHTIPPILPCRVDPMNLVVQKGKPRATIDKTMQLSSSAHPSPVESYNDHLSVAEERESYPFKLITVGTLTRASAILATAGVTVTLGKFDCSTFFRNFGKQRIHIPQSGRLLKTLYGFDYRVNFGEGDAMDHTGAVTNALCFLVRIELKRLSKEYPSRCSRILAWVAFRLGLDQGAGTDRDFTFAVYFFFGMYVDDAALTCFADIVYDHKGLPISVLSSARDGSPRTLLLTRDNFFFDAAMGIINRFALETPVKKQEHMGFLLEFLGVDCHALCLCTTLSAEKSLSYRSQIESVLAEGVTLQNSLTAVHREGDDGQGLNPLLHKLLHASIAIPIGRAHLFHLRKCAKAPNQLSWNAIIITKKALGELDWWLSQLAASRDYRTPFASRLEFPVSPEYVIIFYGDASREENDPSASGFGAWWVFDKTFYYIEGRWTPEEVAQFSINVLESATSLMATKASHRTACSTQRIYSHSLAYTDNSTAENISEYGRATTEGLNQLNSARQHWLTQHSIFQSTERVESVDNDIADLLSRGDIEEALRFPRTYELEIVRVTLLGDERDLSFIAPTWDVVSA